MKSEKCVLVLDENLPLGLAANTAAILGVTLGKRLPEIVGADVRDGGGKEHLGIVAFPIPVLKSTPERIRALRERIPEEVTAVDFTELAQGCRTYGEFTGKMAGTPPEELRYLGLGICGPRKAVDRLTGSLPLLR